ncbi:unnamed protein product [Pleuronectes platessa]|uniref:FERM and PDZ domain containing 1 n=1 Tax=Pleuronectes platessa TaxID=8262 RepID=A0A9N7W3Z8_PLEPL|nr:unnamed protein product [Pleuronectes platessa]
MEVEDRSRSPSRKTSRVEQVVGRWLRRSRDLGSRSHSLSRDRVAENGKTAESCGSDQRNYPFRFNIQIPRDPTLNSHGLTLSPQAPILVQEVTPGGPADGRLIPGDQLVKINNVAVDDLTPEQTAEIIRECQDMLTMTVLRTMLGPKSSFITPEKRAKLRSNPVKVHFAEEVEVNGHCQGNSLLFLPNVLKVYLENGQTKAFKFEPSTTVKDIVMTLKEKLSLSRIELFSLVLEQQHSISKLLLLHDEERIQQVVQKKEAHDYRCLFRICFLPKNFQTLLQEDPTAFEYLYLQGVNDVLQERFAVEMRCNTALRLAALHIQERLASCGQSSKTNLKIITKTWGIENFVSSTLLRNMREKDLRKAIGYHMKKSQSQHDTKQKGVAVDHARINYLEELAELKSFGGKSFSATMMLQDRESMVTLLVGARYGVSQVVNHKLSILSTLTEFTCITRIELLPESDKVSLVKIYLQDIKPITLLLESVAAKEMSCLIAGYCRVFVDPSLNIFPWIDDPRKHRVSAEEGYVSRCGSNSDDSSDLDMEPLVSLVSFNERPCPRPHLLAPPPAHSHPLINFTSQDRGGGRCRRSGDGADPQLIAPISTSQNLHHAQKCSSNPCSDERSLCFAELSRLVDFLPSPPEASEDDEDEEEDLRRRRDMLKEMDHPVRRAGEGGCVSGEGGCKEYPLSLSPSSDSSHMDFVFNFDKSDARCYYKLCSSITPDSARSLPRTLYHNEGEVCEEVEGDVDMARELEPIPILQPPPGFGDSSSDEEFFDARDRFTSPEDPASGALPKDISTEMKLDLLSTLSLSDIRVTHDKAGRAPEDNRGEEEKGGGRETLFQLRKRSRKRRSFMETTYTSMVSYPEPDPESKQDLVSNGVHVNLLAEDSDAQMLSSDPEPTEQSQNLSPTVSSLTHSEGEPAQLESKPILSKACSNGSGSPSASGSHETAREAQPSSRTKTQEMEMEPDKMESKSVTDQLKATSPSITVVRCRVDPDGKESADRRGDGKEIGEGQQVMGEGKEEEEKEKTTGVSGKGPFTCHMFLPEIVNELQMEEDMGEEKMEAVPLDTCGCPVVYTNCFSGGDSFDDELTVYEFSCRTQSTGVTQTSGAVLPLMTSPRVLSFLSPSSTHSPAFPRSILFSSSTSELSPLLSPLSDTSDCFPSQTHKDIISRLGQQRYLEPPAGFQELRVEVDQLLSILESSGSDRSVAGHGGRHPRDTCPAHFTENKRVLQMEARSLMSSCQKVVGIEQSPMEMLHSLGDSFRTLVKLASICLWFSGCDRCDRRNAEAVAGLADVARSFREFCLAAERASSKRSCQDLSTKLLAKQCTALTASVFCFTQLFRTLTAL